MTSMAMQAVTGLDVVAADGVVRVKDGQDTWLCEEVAYDTAVAELESRDADPSDDGGAEAYTELCMAVRGPVASVIGRCRGEWEALVNRAVAADLVDADDAIGMYGVEVQS